MVHYPWHALFGRRVRIERSDVRTTGRFVHVEILPGVVTVVAAWMLDASACVGMEIARRSLRDLILIGGGLFLIWKATKEIHHTVDPEDHKDEMVSHAVNVTLGGAIFQILTWSSRSTRSSPPSA